MVTQPAVERDEVPRPRLKLDGSVTPVRFLFSAASKIFMRAKRKKCAALALEGADLEECG